MPGKIPAANNPPIDIPETIPIMIRSIDGGIMGPGDVFGVGVTINDKPMGGRPYRVYMRGNLDVLEENNGLAVAPFGLNRFCSFESANDIGEDGVHQSF